MLQPERFDRIYDLIGYTICIEKNRPEIFDISLSYDEDSCYKKV